jgi:F-type H+-transporting ATPase subunit epsilon
MSFRLEIISPVKTVFEGEVDSITVPGTVGSFQVLQNHASLISSFEIGKIKVQQGQSTIEYSTGGGIFEVKDNKAIVLAESVESKEEIDTDRANRAKMRAEQMIKLTEVTADEKEEARLALQRAINRLKIAQKK